MPVVKTKLRFGQLGETIFQFLDGASDGLAFVHVLDTDKAAEVAPTAPVVHCVRMQDHRPFALCDKFGRPHNGSFLLGSITAGNMHGNVVEIGQVHLAHSFNQRLILGKTECRKFDASQPQIAASLEARAPIAQRKCSRGKTDQRMSGVRILHKSARAR